MKRSISAALAALAAAGLAGCNDNNIYESGSYVFEVTEETSEASTGISDEAFSEPITTIPEAAEPTTADNSSDDGSEFGKLRCIWTVDGISLVMDKEDIQFIEMEDLPTADDVIIEDFNSDGYEDVFIPDKSSGNGKDGNYWIYDPENKKFEASQERYAAGGIIKR